MAKKEIKKGKGKVEEKVVEKRPVFSKADLINSISENSDYAKSAVEDITNAVFSTINDALVEGSDVQIHKFGTFCVKDTKARNARNPKTGETIQVDASKRIGFKVAKNVKDAVKNV